MSRARSSPPDRVARPWVRGGRPGIIDAVPGRLNETWFNARKEGVYYGQCRELCGKDHAFMPIAVRVVPQAQFDTWMNALKAGSVEDANKTLPPLTAADVSPPAA